MVASPPWQQSGRISPPIIWLARLGRLDIYSIFARWVALASAQIAVGPGT